MSLLANRRSFASSIIRGSSSVDNPESYINLDRITIEALLFDRRFVEAVVYVREISEEGRLPNTAFWEKEIDLAIIHGGKDIAKIRSDAARIRDALFPDKSDYRDDFLLF